MRSFVRISSRLAVTAGLMTAMGLSLAQAQFAQAQTASQPSQPAASAAQTLARANVAVLPEASSRNLTCETLLETAGYQQAALQSVVEKRAVAAETGQPTSELEKLIQESQARLDHTQSQINTACAA